MNRKDLKVGMRVALGKRGSDGSIQLSYYHNVQDSTDGVAIVKSMKSKIVIEVAARWMISTGPGLEFKKGLLETKTFEYESARNILGPWEPIALEYNAQIDKYESNEKLRRDLSLVLGEYDISHSNIIGDLTIKPRSFQRLLDLLNTIP